MALPFDPRWLAIGIPVLVIGIRMVRARKPRRLRPQRMWIMPVFVTLAIGLGLAFSPHPAFGLGTAAWLAAGAVAGVAAGRWRAGHVALAHADDGTVMASMSPVAMLVLLALFVVRQASGRSGLLGRDAMLTVTDATMLFVLAMLLTQQWLVWRKVRAFGPPA